MVTSNYDQRASITGMLAELNWNTLKEHCDKKDMIMFHKVVKGETCLDINDYLTKYDNISRAHDQCFHKPQPTVDAFKYPFFMRMVPPWNCLPENLAQLDNKHFKMAYKEKINIT